MFIPAKRIYGANKNQECKDQVFKDYLSQAIKITEEIARFLLGNRVIDRITSWLIDSILYVGDCHCRRTVRPDYVINKPNPVVQLFYLAVAGGGFYIYVTVAFVKYVPGPLVGSIHIYSGSAIMFVCYYSFYMASVIDAGVISDK